MSYSIERAGAVLDLHEPRLNGCLIALLASGGDADGLRKELSSGLVQTACMHLLPDGRRLPAELYVRHMVGKPFGATGVDGIAVRLRDRMCDVDDAAAAVVLDALRAFHEAFGRRNASGELGVDAIYGMVGAVRPVAGAGR